MIRRGDLPLGYQLDKNGRVISYKALDGTWREYKRDADGNVTEYRSSFGENYVYLLRNPADDKKDTAGLVIACWCVIVFSFAVAVCAAISILS